MDLSNAVLEEAIGYHFKKPTLLKAALTHPSKVSSKKPSVFERLEFLGDRVLGLVVADLLYHRYPDEKEGDLAKRLASLVCRETISEIAATINLMAYLQLARDEMPSRSSVLCDAMEALIGAVYLDGGIKSAQIFINQFWPPLLEKSILPPKDSKTALQEWAQGRGKSIPHYVIVTSSGPAHKPTFTIKVTVEGLGEASGSGASKREAEQVAAKLLLDRILSP